MARRAVRTSRWRHTRETFRTRPDGSLVVGVVADTHGAPHPGAAVHLAALAPDRVVHAGDIGDLAVLEGLARIAPVTAVRGNIDEHAADLPDAVTIDVLDGEAPVVRLLLVHIAVFGPRLRAETSALARAEEAAVVVCGHSHVPFFGRDRGVVVMNPGSIGPRRFHLPIVFGVLSIERGRIGFHHVSCETGARWEPGPV